MSTTTPKGIPIPEDTDRVMDGASAMRSLGSKVDTMTPYATWVTSGQAVVTAANFAVVTITAPVGKFLVPPRIVATVTGTSLWFAYVNSTSATSISIGVRCRDATNTTMNVNVNVIAMQMLVNLTDG